MSDDRWIDLLQKERGCINELLYWWLYSQGFKQLISLCVQAHSVSLYMWLSIPLPSETQPKKIRKVPPGLPSSVSTNIQKRCSPELYLRPCIQFIGNHVYKLCPFSYCIWRLNSFNTGHSAPTAVYLQHRYKKKKREKKATHSPSHSFLVYL